MLTWGHPLTPPHPFINFSQEHTISDSVLSHPAFRLSHTIDKGRTLWHKTMTLHDGKQM